jgi:integrase
MSQLETPCSPSSHRLSLSSLPALAAYSGARVGEVAQLRRQDVRQEAGHWLIELTPEAGTIKTNEARKVVLHPHLIELGFPQWAQSQSEGHLFLKPAATGDVLGPLQGVKNRLAEFARTVVTDPNVAPLHGLRHRFKTIGMDSGVSTRVLDAIQGHAPRTAGDGYREVTVKAMADAMAKLPRVEVQARRVDGEAVRK